MKKMKSIILFGVLLFGIASPMYGNAEELTSTTTSETVLNSETKAAEESTTQPTSDHTSSVGTNSTDKHKATTASTQESTDKSSAATEKAAPTAAVDHGSQYFTDVSFTDIAGNPLAKVSDSDKIKVHYTFAIPEAVHPNETMTIQLPEQLKLVNYTDFPLMDAAGNIIANATTDTATGLMTLTFTDSVEGKTDTNGSLFFWAKFDKTKVTDGANTLAMPVNGATTDVQLTVRKSAGTTTGNNNPTVVFKSGAFDKNDPSIINWTITINNAQQRLIQPRILDTIGPGQTLLTNSFIVNYRDTNKKSLKKYSLVPGQDIENSWTKVAQTDTGFQLYLDNLGSASTINNYASAVITYKTKVDASTTRYINGAGTNDEAGQPQNRNASVNVYGSGGSASGTINEAIDQLTDIIDEAESIDETELTPDDAAKLNDEIHKAHEIVDNEEATLEQLDAASDNLEEVIQEVVPSTEQPPVDTKEIEQALKELQAAVDEANNKKAEEYTPESWQPVADAKAQAEKVLKKGQENPANVTLNEVNSAKENLAAAVQKLVKREQPQSNKSLKEALARLEKLLADLNQKVRSLYTEDSWQKVMDLKDEANRLIASGKATLAQVNDLIQRLTAAMSELKLKTTTPNAENTSVPISTSSYISKSPTTSYQSSLPKMGEDKGTALLILGILAISLATVMIYYKK